MSVLDELREQVKKRARWTVCIDELFDKFKAEHPGLVHHTVICPECKTPHTGTYVGGFPYSEYSNLCPACIKGADNA